MEVRVLSCSCENEHEMVGLYTWGKLQSLPFVADIEIVRAAVENRRCLGCGARVRVATEPVEEEP